MDEFLVNLIVSLVFAVPCFVMIRKDRKRHEEHLKRLKNLN